MKGVFFILFLALGITCLAQNAQKVDSMQFDYQGKTYVLKLKDKITLAEKNSKEAFANITYYRLDQSPGTTPVESNLPGRHGGKVATVVKIKEFKSGGYQINIVVPGKGTCFLALKGALSSGEVTAINDIKFVPGDWRKAPDDKTRAK